MAIFPPAISGTSPMSGIYASLRQAQIIILEILQCMDASPAVFNRGDYNPPRPPPAQSPGFSTRSESGAFDLILEKYFILRQPPMSRTLLFLFTLSVLVDALPFFRYRYPSM